MVYTILGLIVLLLGIGLMRSELELKLLGIILFLAGLAALIKGQKDIRKK